MSTKIGSEAPALFGRTRSALLAILYGHTDKPFYLRQLARMMAAGHGALQQELKTLTALGLIVRTHQGNQVLYQANARSPIFAEIRGLVAKTVGVHDSIRAALAPLDSQIQFAFVYGSVACQQERTDSDIDLMVIGEVSFAAVVAALCELQETLGREVNPTIFGVEEFKSKLDSGNHFLRSVMREKKLFVLGTQDELTKLAAKRLVG